MFFVVINHSVSPVDCDSDAKICPDGTLVGRTAPNCEFAVCVEPKPKNIGMASSSEISIENIQAGQVLVSPVTIHGQALSNWYFEAVFPIIIKNSTGKEIARTQAHALTDWAVPGFVPFEATVSFETSTTTAGTLVFQNDNPSGLTKKQKSFELPIVLAPASSTSLATLDVKVYFMNNNLDPEVSCNKVFPVIRQITKTQAVASATMAELLAGPTEAEKAKGYSTTINPGVKIQKLTITNGVAKIDFDKAIEKGVAGSCLVTAIRSEISETLKQFPSVQEVVISVEGRTEDILQP